MRTHVEDGRKITINMFGDVVCPFPDPGDKRHITARYFEEDEGQVTCNRNHTHSIKDFPEVRR